MFHTVSNIKALLLALLIALPIFVVENTAFANNHAVPWSFCNAAAKDDAIAPAIKRNFLAHFNQHFSHLHFRDATPSDLPVLQPFINSVRNEFIAQGDKLDVVFDDDLARLDEVFRNNESALFVMTQDESKIVGSGGFARTAPREVELRKIYLDPSQRGTQLGKSWVRSLISLAKALGNKRMWLYNHRNLTRATDIYKKEGFKVFTPTADIAKGLNVDDYWFMELNLDDWVD